MAATLGGWRGHTMAAETEEPLQRPLDDGLKLLQGTWEGSTAADPAGQRITITVRGDSLHFHRDTNFWFLTTIVLPSGTEPKQLRATIKASAASDASSIGQVVPAIFKIEDGTLTLAAYDLSEKPPNSFADVTHPYVLRKVAARPRVRPSEAKRP